MTHNEALSLIKINLLLEEAGWRFFDTAEGKDNIILENHVKITQKVVGAGGSDFEKMAVCCKSTAVSHIYFNCHLQLKPSLCTTSFSFL